MNIKNFDEVVNQLRAYLPQYLEERGIDISSHFTCLDPSHEDKDPSCSIEGGVDQQLFHCFGCHAHGDIFTARHLLEGKPLAGPGFIDENLIPLAEKYGVEIESTPLTEEQIYEMDTYRAYREVSDYITYSKKNKVFNKAIEDRGWNADTCRQFGVGCVTDYNEFRAHLKSRGFSAGFLDDVDLSRKDIFGENCLIFTIKDEYGRPVGFASRNLKFDGDKKNGSKYVNQKHTGVKCNIYRKSERLYGLDHVLKNRDKRTKSVYVFEGYTDVRTAVHHGLNNCVALGGTAFTAEQVNLLRQHNLYNIILCLDGDQAGAERTAAILDTSLSGHKDLSVSIIMLPEKMDPDEIIRSKGINSFKKLKKWSAFEWRLAQFSDEEDGFEVCKSMVPLIINETSYIEQEKQCSILANFTAITLKTIQAELARQQNQREAEKSRDRQVIIDRMSCSITKNPDQAETIVQQAQAELFDLARRYNEDSFSEDSCLARIDTQKVYEEAKDGSFSGYILGPDLHELQEALCGEWKKDVWFCFAGKPNCGKTSFLCKLVYEIARREENNALVIYHSIDDTTEQILPKFICIAEGSKRLLLNHVTDPNYHKNNLTSELDRQKLDERRETGYSIVRDLIRRGRLIIKDANDGNGIAYAHQVIRYYQEKYPGRNVIYVLDNFHKSKDFKSMSKDERVRFKDMSEVMKELATSRHCCVLASVEYKKIEKGKRGSNADIAETGQIEYDANFVAHFYNEMHEDPDTASSYHTEVLDGKMQKLPVVEMDIGKNKITAFKNKLFLNFWPSSSDFIGTDANKVIAEQKERIEELKNDYLECVEVARKKGHKLGRAAYLFLDRHPGLGLNDIPISWKDEVLKTWQGDA